MGTNMITQSLILKSGGCDRNSPGLMPMQP